MVASELVRIKRGRYEANRDNFKWHGELLTDEQDMWQEIESINEDIKMLRELMEGYEDLLTKSKEDKK